MDYPQLAFIGGGNMAEALIGGLCAKGHPPKTLRVADPDPARRRSLADSHSVTTGEDNAEIARGSAAVVLAVKPQVMDPVLASLSEAVGEHMTVISVAAGITLGRLRQGLPAAGAIIRAMPNTPALHGAGITGLCAEPGCSDGPRELASLVLGAGGETVWIEDEALMDAVTAVSGSGPAYFFALTEHLAAAGERAGLPSGIAQALARQTAIGAGEMLKLASEPAGELRRRVTSPGGTTAAALDSLTADDFETVIGRAVEAAVQRGRQLGAK